jgi:hypothetical protein
MTKYNTDFYAWTQDQATHLRDGVWTAVDVTHVAEEIESLGIAENMPLSANSSGSCCTS